MIITEQNMKNRIFVIAAALLGMAFGPTLGQGTVIAQHSGGADPIEEGFTLKRAGNPSLAPVMNDLGLDAWSVNLNSLSDIAQYSSRLTAQQGTDAEGEGWVLSLTLRVVEPFNSPTFATFASFHTGAKYFSLLFGALATGDPMVTLNGTRYTLVGAGSGYHSYQLKYDSGMRQAGLWMDGSYVADSAGFADPSSPLLVWGADQHDVPAAHANWSEVSLSIIPEPSCVVLLCCGALLLAASRLRAGRQ
jgi:hypothetical protein